MRNTAMSCFPTADKTQECEGPRWRSENLGFPRRNRRIILYSEFATLLCLEVVRRAVGQKEPKGPFCRPRLRGKKLIAVASALRRLHCCLACFCRRFPPPFARKRKPRGCCWTRTVDNAYMIAARSVCASAICGNSSVGEKPSSAGARTAWASAERPTD
jgi:hypothetical protein